MLNHCLKTLAGTALLCAAGTAIAHPHTTHTGQVIANRQLHPPFTLVSGQNDNEPTFLVESCDTTGTADPAWYGLERAHHGPDLGEPGLKDGCYMTTGMINPAWLTDPTKPKYVPLPSDHPGFAP